MGERFEEVAVPAASASGGDVVLGSFSVGDDVAERVRAAVEAGMQGVVGGVEDARQARALDAAKSVEVELRLGVEVSAGVLKILRGGANADLVVKVVWGE